MPYVLPVALLVLLVSWAFMETFVLRETLRDAMRRFVFVVVVAAYMVLLALTS